MLKQSIFIFFILLNVKIIPVLAQSNYSFRYDSLEALYEVLVQNNVSGFGIDYYNEDEKYRPMAIGLVLSAES
jgi:hypothetical protein